MHDPGAPELRETVSARARMEQGLRVGARARSYVPGGVLIERGGRSVEAMVAETWEALQGDTPAIYEACVHSTDVLLFADILERAPSGFTLIEVKSGTSVADDHIIDAALQMYAWREARVDIARVEIMHLNRECRYPDLSTLFIRSDVTDRVHDVLSGIGPALDVHRHTIAGPLPTVATGDHCTKPSGCPFIDRCWPPLPEHHVSTLYRISKKKVAEWTNAGYHTIPELPDYVSLSAIAARQRRAVCADEVIVEREALANALQSLVPPVAHLDFETVQLAIPIWDGCRPHEHVPVQMSCHVVGPDGVPRHIAWLADGPDDPREPLARAIVEACREAVTVTAYFAQFEKDRLHELAIACPAYAEELTGIANRIVDLLPIIRNHVYHPAFGGSFSLKAVLPALVPALRYDDLSIAEGETASLELARLMFGASTMDPAEHTALRAALLAYCERDTEAMVALTERLRGLCHEQGA
jgi:predicted RecB family nuclease